MGKLPKGIKNLENLMNFLILISVVFDDFVNIFFFLVPTSAVFQGTGSKTTE